MILSLSKEWNVKMKTNEKKVPPRGDLEGANPQRILEGALPLVKRCCASCAHKKLTRTTMRWCRLWDRLTRSSNVCDEWMMNKTLCKLTLNIER